MQYRHVHYEEIKPFDLLMTYAEPQADSVENVHDSHTHEGYEIYINISGDVSFIVENHIYPIKPGDIIITRPFEYHHCIYHSNRPHKHFWILFTGHGNDTLPASFYKRESGEGNRLTLSPEGTDTLLLLCRKMLSEERPQSERYYDFFKLLHLLQSAETARDDEVPYPLDVTYAINYINTHFTQPITIRDIAKNANVSLNTLERHFAQILNISPSAYIQKKRLTNAVKLLSTGHSVSEASENSGFADYSHFIMLFKKSYGITPFQYKKNLQTKC